MSAAVWMGRTAVGCAGFTSRLAERWRVLRASTLSTEHLETLLAETEAQIRDAAIRNLERWPEAAEAHGYPAGASAEEVFDAEVALLRERLLNKAQWMDGNIDGFGL